MEHFSYRTKGTCAQVINFDLDGDKVRNIEFIGGCNGNLKAISILVEGMSPDEIEAKLLGNTCGMKTTSCADQLAKAVRQAADSVK
ncbi:MAG: TIGR03905 family TSCPD domain-containing protein [Lachnospiraceae bacterium]|jgi:uncharacterized protein (TIGR03905 family)